MRRRLPLVATLGVVVILMVVAMVTGGWWAPFVLCLAVGLLVTHRAWIALPLGAAIGLLTWGVPLVVRQFQVGIGSTAGALSAILGFGHAGAYAIALTLLVGMLLGLTGAWLGSAARGLVVASRARVDARKA